MSLILFSIWKKSSLSTYICANAYKSTVQAGESISKSLQELGLNHLVSICGISDGSVIAEFWNVALNECLIAVVTIRRCSGKLWALCTTGTACCSAQISFGLLIVLLQHPLLSVESPNLVALQWMVPTCMDADSSGTLMDKANQRTRASAARSGQHSSLSQALSLSYFFPVQLYCISWLRNS